MMNRLFLVFLVALLALENINQSTIIISCTMQVATEFVDVRSGYQNKASSRRDLR